MNESDDIPMIVIDLLEAGSRGLEVNRDLPSKSIFRSKYLIYTNKY